MHPTVVVLAGGGSRRMGRDKALLEVRGAPMLARVVAAARGAGLRCVVLGRTSGDVTAITGIDEWIDDEMPGEGPLAALATALRRLACEVILVACDMPLLDAAAFAWLAQQVPAPGELGLVPRNAGVLEPLFARYRPESLPEIDALLGDGRRSIGALIATGALALVDAPDWLRTRLINVNSPEDVDALEGGAQQP